MGTTITVRARLRKHHKARKSIEADLRVEPGVVYSIVPAMLLGAAGIAPEENKETALPDGRTIRRPCAGAYVEVAGRSGYTRVLFGQDDDPALLGRMVLDLFGLEADEAAGVLRPVPQPPGPPARTRRRAP